MLVQVTIGPGIKETKHTSLDSLRPWTGPLRVFVVLVEIVSGERTQHELHFTHICRGSADAYADAGEAVSLQGTEDGLHTPVAARTPRGSDANLPQGQVHIVVYDENVLNGSVEATNQVG